MVVPTRVLVEDIQKRLASLGGVLGIWVGTLSDLSEQVLTENREYYLRLSEIPQRKLLQNLLLDLPLDYFKSIQYKPGFTDRCLAIIRELKMGGITPSSNLYAAEKILGSRPDPVLCFLNYRDSIHLETSRWK